MNFQNVEFELAAGRASQLPKSICPEIVFSGRSNVGKSSLINKLVNRKSLARTSSTPGKTATINFYRLSSCRFVDLPGYGYAKVSKGERERWADLVNGYFAQNREIALVLQLLDMRHKPTRDDMQMIEFLLSNRYHFSAICTKSDKLNQKETLEQTKLFCDIFDGFGVSFLPFSAANGDGLDSIKALIESYIDG